MSFCLLGSISVLFFGEFGFANTPKMMPCFEGTRNMFIFSRAVSVIF